MASVDEFTIERDVYLQMALLEVFMNGVYTALFLLTVYAMVFKRQLYRKNPGLFIVVLAMYIISTVHVAEWWTLIRQAFIFHAESPDTTAAYLITHPLWMVMLGATTLTANTVIADCILIWRCWMVWNRDWKVAVFPIISAITGTVFGAFNLAQQARFILTGKDMNAYIDYATPYFSLSLLTTVMCTVLIVGRILHLTHGTVAVGGSYGSVIEIVVESAALYSLTLVIYLPMLVRNEWAGGYPQAIIAQITGIAPTLIVARVSLGMARPDTSWKRHTGTSLQFGQPAGSDSSDTRIGVADTHPSMSSFETNISMKHEGIA